MQNIEIKNSNKPVEYESAVEFMKKKIEQIQNGKSKELIWFLTHENIYTQGTSSSMNEIIKKNKIKVIRTNRGGKTTYHGPGQRIIYFMINLNYRKKDIRKFINLLEESIITFLSNYGIRSRSFKNRVGVWVTEIKGLKLKKEKKIAAIGLRVSKWITYHGLSFNINPNLENYNYINSCGLSGYKNTSLDELGIKINVSEFDKYLKDILIEKLNNFN